MSKCFVINEDGVHLQGPFSDYTLCGDTMDGDTKVDIDPPIGTDNTKITCEKCLIVIRLCQSVDL